MNVSPRQTVALGLGAAATAIGIWYAGRSSADHRDATRPAASAPAPEAYAALPPPQVVAAPPLGPATPGRSPSAAASTVKPAPAQGDVVARSDAQLASEPFDRGWAGPIAQSLSEGIRHASIDGVDVRAIECRSTICRVSLHYTATSEQPRKVFEAMCIGPKSELVSQHVGCFLGPPQTAADGSGDGKLFVYRDGKMPGPVTPNDVE